MTSKVFKEGGLRALTALLLLLVPGCSQVGNKVSDSEAIIQGTTIGYQGTSMAASTTALAVAITFNVIPRNQGSQAVSPLSAVEFLTFTMTTTSPSVGVTGGNMEGIFYPVGSSGNVIIIGLGAKVLGASYTGHIRFDGVDNLGKAVSFDIDYGTVVTP
jgi:hypothetical protein